jgi:hypothetical protein
VNNEKKLGKEIESRRDAIIIANSNITLTDPFRPEGSVRVIL